MPRKAGLTPKQKRFVAEYLVDFNATQAAIRAGYSPASARQQACDLLTNPYISEAVKKGEEKVLEAIGLTRGRVLREMMRLAYLDIGEAFDSAGFLKPLNEMPEDIRRAIVGLEVSEIFGGEGDQKSIIGHLKKVKLADKKGALELLGKHLKTFSDRVEHTGRNGEPLSIHIDLGG